MAIEFEIEELGPIRDSIIEFKPFTIFSGESNSGKSYTAFAVYYLFYIFKKREETFRNLILSMFDLENIKKELDENNKIELDVSFQKIENFYNDNISNFMSYILGNEDFQCNIKLKTNIFEPMKFNIIRKKETINQETSNIITRIKNSTFSVEYSIFPHQPFFEKEGLIRELSDFLAISFYSSLLGKNYLPTLFSFILPPARGSIIDASYSMKQNMAVIGMYNEFIKDMDIIKYPQHLIKEEEKIKDNHEVIELLSDILQGKVKVTNDRIIYEFQDKEIPLSGAASSIKELSPLYLILKRLRSKELSILIEEPEAHLHPELQRKVASILSYVVNQGGFIQTTTHSDYFLNQINNFIRLYYIKEKNEEKFKEAIQKTSFDEKFILDPVNIGAYYFKQQQDNYVKIEQLKVDESGIPFKTFENTVNKMIDDSDYIKDILYSLEE